MCTVYVYVYVCMYVYVYTYQNLFLNKDTWKAHSCLEGTGRTISCGQRAAGEDPIIV